MTPHRRHSNNLAWGADATEAVSEEIRDHHEVNGTEPEEAAYDGRWGPLQLPAPFCVYTIHCNAHSTDGEFKKQAQIVGGWCEDEIPSWAWAAHFEHQRIYVGSTQNPYRRLGSHVWDPDTAALFNRLFPPKFLRGIDWYDTKEEARRAEASTADRLEDELLNTFVYQA